MGNNAINQLNVIGNLTNSSSKYKNLFNVVNNTSTPMGERYLKSMLSSPLTNIKELNKIYDMNNDMKVDQWQTYDDNTGLPIVVASDEAFELR